MRDVQIYLKEVVASRSWREVQAPAHVKKGVPLTETQTAKAVEFLMAWIERQMV